MGLAEAAYDAATTTAMAPATLRTRIRIFRDYLAFAFHHRITDIIALGSILAYAQHLSQLGLHPRTILNYVSTLKAHLQMTGHSTEAFQHSVFKAFGRSVLRRPSQLKPKGVFSRDNIDTLFRVNQSLPDHQPYAVAFALGFYACLRISNIVPPSKTSFDSQCQLIRSDVTFHLTGVDIYIKWAKNLQQSDQTHVVRVPRIDSKPHLCPFRALAYIFRAEPALPTSPLLMWKSQVLTERDIRQRLQKIVTLMGLRTAGLSFHALRRSAVTLAFSNNVSMHHIKNHGAWRSEAVWHYVKRSEKLANVVPDALGSLFA